ncbi:hypothetical protein ACWDOR_37885 [Streptosporangium canum]
MGVLCIGANAITTLKPLAALDLPTAFAVVDRAYTDQRPAHFAQPARELGYRLALDYKVDQPGMQGSAHGALLIDGSLACPLIPDRLAMATTGLEEEFHSPWNRGAGSVSGDEIRQARESLELVLALQRQAAGIRTPPQG